MFNKNKGGNLELYDGLTCPKTFFEQFTLICLFENWTDTNDKAGIVLKAFLKGKALTAYNTAVVDNKKTIADISAVIITACEKSLESKMAKFTERRQKQNESLASYSHELNKLLIEAMPTIGATERQAIVRSQIISNAPVEMKEMLKLSATLGGDAFVKYVNQCDEVTSHKTTYSTQTLIKEEPIDVNYMNTNSGFYGNRNQRGGYSNTTSRISNGSNKNNYFDGICYNCDVRGHRLVDCPARAAEIKATLQQQRGNSSNYNNYRGNSEGRNYISNGYSNRAGNNNRQSTNRQGGGSGGGGSNGTNNANHNAVEVEQASNTFQEDGQFPWFNNADNFMTEMVEITSLETKLLKITTRIELFKDVVIYPHTLLDCGSNYSFISPSMFTGKNKFALNYNEDQIETKQFRINAAMGMPEICSCKVVNAKIKIGSWEGYTKFVISDMVTKHEALLGRDFFVQNKVVIDHGKDTLSIQENTIHISQLESRPMHDYNQEIIDLRNEVQRLQILREKESLINNKHKEQIDQNPIIVENSRASNGKLNATHIVDVD